ncbi:MAG: DUF4235 domain-containing protein [Candidatus Nanopelagicales bacterium]|jgi:hypothetical protein|nr:DUF4235 domain-containing protein [Candidatus Nanopelagicales bacterium]
MAKKTKKKNNSSGIVVSLVVLLATFLARKILTKSYTKVMGQTPPKSGDTDQPIGRVLTWTALSTIALAAVEGLVQKYLGKNKF